MFRSPALAQCDNTADRVYHRPDATARLDWRIRGCSIQPGYLLEMDPKKRGFLRGRVFRHSPDAVRPPWSGSAARFYDVCTRCNSCISACPEKILFAGDGGFPEVNFQLGECTFCAQCTSACTDDVFDLPPHDVEKAWSLTAEITPSCLSLNAVLCRTCGESCPVEAINFHLRTGGIAVPAIQSSDCTGCGACLYVCPKNSVVLKYRSIPPDAI